MKLIAITTLGLTLGFYSSSFASDSYNALGVQLPMVKRDVENKVSGRNVEKDFMSFYTSPKTANTTASLITADQKSDDEYIAVFGVQILRSLRL